MIIGQITNEELNRRDDPKQEKRFAYIPSGVRAVQLLQAWLTTVNEAGLEGKRLKNFRVHGTHDIDFDDTLYQLHADVEHRLRTQPTTVEAGMLQEIDRLRSKLYDLGWCSRCDSERAHDIDEPFSQCRCGTSEDTGPVPALQRLRRAEAENANLRYALRNMLKRWKSLEAAQTDGLGFRFPDARDREAMMNAEHLLDEEGSR